MNTLYQALKKACMYIAIWFVTLAGGAYLDAHYVHYFSKLPVPTGEPKADIPDYGSAVRVHYVHTDGSYLATHAGQTLFYNPKDRLHKLVTAGHNYEVALQKKETGGGTQKIYKDLAK